MQLQWTLYFRSAQRTTLFLASLHNYPTPNSQNGHTAWNIHKSYSHQDEKPPRSPFHIDVAALQQGKFLEVKSAPKEADILSETASLPINSEQREN